METILVTGASGFIGSNLCKKLLSNNYNVIGIDNMNDYYDVSLKEYRLKTIRSYDNYTFIKGSIVDKELINKIFNEYKPKIVVNLAASVGVRYSIDNPDIYIENNIIGFYNILEACKNYKVDHLVYASSSSVYGDNSKVPFSTEDKVDSPVSLYAATKKSDELISHAYSSIYNLNTTGLRFFTVYGPAGRPDMAYFNFTNSLINGDKIKIYNHGNHKRDFTYIDDIVEGIYRVIINKPKNNYNLYNIGNGKPINLLDFITILQEELIKEKVLPNNYDFESHKDYVDKAKGDVDITYADTTKLEKDFNYRPKVDIREGLSKFVKWYKEYYIDGGNK